VALDTFTAGSYSSAYAATACGITEGGYELTFETQAENIAESDRFGQSLIDLIWRGGSATLDAVFLAYKPGSLSVFWPYGGAINAAGVLGILEDTTIAAPNKLPIGSLGSDIAKALVLTVVAGTPAASNGPFNSTLTANKALLRPGFPGKLVLNSKLKKVPVSLVLLPYDAGGGIYKFCA
jgi:hypothetical protein